MYAVWCRKIRGTAQARLPFFPARIVVSRQPFTDGVQGSLHDDVFAFSARRRSFAFSFCDQELALSVTNELGETETPALRWRYRGPQGTP